jgi:prepilin-type N-terminal cleavage/methylation domain-containing protein
MNRGITLIELIVVLAIVSVLLAVVGPSISSGLDNVVLTSEGRRVLAAFRLAQNTARETGQQVFATYDESNLRFLKVGETYQTMTLPRGIRFVSPEQASPLVFLESGQIAGPDRLELLNARGRRVELSIDHARGLIKFEGRELR